ncbi:DUF6702 family protein [Soonwooa purpurea]
MKKYFNIFGVLFLLIAMSFTGLEMFSSMTKVEFVEGSKTLKFTTKLSTSHISKALNIDPNTTGFDAEVKKYVNANVAIAVNGSSKVLTFTGSQVNGESVFVYYEASGVSDVSSLKIKNSILTSVYPKQVNIVNISYKGNLKTVNFQKGKETADVTF